MYTPEAWRDFDMTEKQLVAKMTAAYPRMNQAMLDSKIDLNFWFMIKKVSTGVEEARTHRTSWCDVYAWQQRCPISVSTCFDT